MMIGIVGDTLEVTPQFYVNLCNQGCFDEMWAHIDSELDKLILRDKL
jgi:hypothetical protein